MHACPRRCHLQYVLNDFTDLLQSLFGKMIVKCLSERSLPTPHIFTKASIGAWNWRYASCSFWKKDLQSIWQSVPSLPWMILWGALFLLPLSTYPLLVFSSLLNFYLSLVFWKVKSFLVNYQGLCLCVFIFTAGDFQSFNVPVPGRLVFQLPDSFSLVLISFEVLHQLNVIVYVVGFPWSVEGSGSLILVTINCSEHL